MELHALAVASRHHNSRAVSQRRDIPRRTDRPIAFVDHAWPVGETLPGPAVGELVLFVKPASGCRQPDAFIYYSAPAFRREKMTCNRARMPSTSSSGGSIGSSVSSGNHRFDGRSWRALFQQPRDLAHCRWGGKRHCLEFERSNTATVGPMQRKASSAAVLSRTAAMTLAGGTAGSAAGERIIFRWFSIITPPPRFWIKLSGSSGRRLVDGFAL